MIYGKLSTFRSTAALECMICFISLMGMRIERCTKYGVKEMYKSFDVCFSELEVTAANNLCEL
jgi:hypothetical protein